MCVLSAVAILATSGYAWAETHKVSDLATLERLLSTDSNVGDTIEVQPGTYALETAKIPVLRSGTPERPIVVRGVMKDGQRPVLDASKFNIQRGIFYIEEPTHDVIIENFELCNAAGGGRAGKEQPRNAAGVYILGSNITVRNCRVHHCENGLFSTHESDFVLIENCDIGFNGREQGVGEPHRTHSFYFNSKHQMVKGCYVHDSTDGENFKSRGTNNIFAYNWVDEECAYSLGVDSGNEQNTLWLGNVVVKRTYEGINQGRLLGVGDGTGVARGTLVALNNTFVTIFPRDLYLFTEQSSTCDVMLINNIFAGPGKTFLEKNGKGSVAGTHNWVAKLQEWQRMGPGATFDTGYVVSANPAVPETFKDTIFGENAGFADARAMDFHLVKGSPCIGAGVSAEEYAKAVKLVTQFSREGEQAKASPEWLAVLEIIERSAPALEPKKKATGAEPRRNAGAIDIGAYGYAGK